MVRNSYTFSLEATTLTNFQPVNCELCVLLDLQLFFRGCIGTTYKNHVSHMFIKHVAT